MKGYERYALDVENGNIVTGRYIKLMVKRYRTFLQRKDMYFDADTVDDAILFIRQMKHYLGKSAGKPFVLEPWQEFIVANIFGFKWTESNTRVCRQFFLMVARKAGKSAFAAALNLYLLVADGEAAPEQVFVANSREQARILFQMTQEFAHSLDPTGRDLKPYRNKIDFKTNKGIVKVLSSDSSKLDGLNLSTFTLDEYHEQRDRKLIDVLVSSQGMRTQPLSIIITTAGFNLHSPCHDLYEVSIEILEGVKSDDSLCPFLYMLDEGDKWDDPDVWIKSNPNMGVTVTADFIAGEIQKAKNDPSAEVGVRTKTLNQWCSAVSVWIPQETIVKSMEDIRIEDFKDCPCYMALDLGSVSDFTSLTAMFVREGKYWFFTRTFLPEATLEWHPDRELYSKFIREGSMVLTEGNVCNYNYIAQEISKINQFCPVAGIWLDRWNATQFQITLTEMGYDPKPFSQAIGNYNACTKEFTRLMLEGKVVLQRSSSVSWQFGNATLTQDHNGNVKPDKGAYKNKIDSCISITTALGGYLQEPHTEDFDIMIL